MTSGSIVFRLALVLVLATGPLLSTLAADAAASAPTTQTTDGEPAGSDSEAKPTAEEEATTGSIGVSALTATDHRHTEWGRRHLAPALAGDPSPPPERA